MNNINQQIIRNKTKSLMLFVVFLALVSGFGWVFSYVFGNRGIFYGAIGFSFAMSFFSYWFSDKIVLKMSGAKEADAREFKHLHDTVEKLCANAKMPKPKVYVIDDQSPNAFATGRDPEHAAVAVTSGILAMLNKEELEGVIAHELSHIANRDILIATLASVLVGAVIMLADWFMYRSFFGGSISSDEERDPRIAIFMTVFAVILAILAPIFAQILQLAISRKREFLADASGAVLANNPNGLAGALQKISAYPIGLQKVNRATAHLYISSPIKREKASFWRKAFMTHPPVEERVEALMSGK